MAAAEVGPLCTKAVIQGKLKGQRMQKLWGCKGQVGMLVSNKIGRTSWLCQYVL